MAVVRVIPRLDIKGPNLVKGIHLEGLRVLGNPEDFARYYYENGADELMFMDVVASLYERNSLGDIISKVAREIFIPLTVGGGLRTIEDINTALRAGADKVSINTAAIKNPEFIREASLRFGSSTIVVAIEAIKEADGRYLAYTDNAREFTGVEVVAWAQQVEALGAGEIVLTSVDKEGTGEGLDMELIRRIANLVSIPLIVHGGIGKVSDCSDAIHAGADAVAIASTLHYDYIATHQEQVSERKEGNTEFLKKGTGFSKINGFRIQDVKQHFTKEGIACRNR